MSSSLHSLLGSFLNEGAVLLWGPEKGTLTLRTTYIPKVQSLRLTLWPRINTLRL